MDALSDVLAAVRLSGSVFLDAEFTAPWCIAARIGSEDCRPYGAAPAHIIAYHYVVAGRLVVQLANAAPLEVAAGEIVLLPRNDPHILASAPGLRPVVVDALVQPDPASGMACLRYGGGGEPTQIICGFLGCEVPHNPLVASLPAVLRLALRQKTAGAWMEQSFRLGVEAFAARRAGSGTLGSVTLLSKLAELLFTEAVRGYLATLPEDRTGWLAGLRDPVVGKALALLHTRVAEPWTTERLAREVALSRSSFAERFTALIGTPPMRYLANWRMQLAATSLRKGGRSLAQIAGDVGYESDAAFNRAFKRAYGTAPSA
jgi:AraC-like DNA-binding protein